MFCIQSSGEPRISDMKTTNMTVEGVGAIWLILSSDMLHQEWLLYFTYILVALVIIIVCVGHFF